MRACDELAKDPELVRSAPEGARVTIVTQDGSRYGDFLGQATGMPERPLSDEALADKFRRCAVLGGYSMTAAEALLQRLWGVETIERASSVFSS